MKYRTYLYIRITCFVLLVLMIIQNHMKVSYVSSESIPGWLQYLDIVILSALLIITLIDWKRMKQFYQNQEDDLARKDYRRQTIFNWVGTSIVTIYIILKLSGIIRF